MLIYLLYQLIFKDSNDLNGGTDYLRCIANKILNPKEHIKYRNTKNKLSLFNSKGATGINIENVEANIYNVQRNIWNGYTDIVNCYFETLIDVVKESKKHENGYIIVGDIHSSFINFFVPLIKAGIIINVELRKISPNKTIENQNSINLHLSNNKNEFEDRLIRSMPTLRKQKQKKSKQKQKKSRKFEDSNSDFDDFDSDFDFDFVNINKYESEIMMIEFAPVIPKDIIIIYTGDIIDHSPHGMDLELYNVLMLMTIGKSCNVYLTIGNHDISLYNYIGFKKYIENEQEDLNELIKRSDDGDFMACQRINRRKLLIKDKMNMLSVDINNSVTVYEDYFGFNDEFKEDFDNYFKSEYVKAFYFAHSQIDKPKFVVSHAIIAPKKDDNWSIVINNDLNSKSLTVNINGKEFIINSSGNMLSIFEYINNVTDPIEILYTINIFKSLFSNSFYNNPDIKICNMLNAFGSNISEKGINDNNETLYENLDNIPYYCGHFNIMETLSIKTINEDMLAEIFNSLCNLSGNAILFETIKRSSIAEEKKYAREIIENFINGNNIFYCDFGASTYTKNFETYRHYEFISYTYIDDDKHDANNPLIYVDKPQNMNAIFDDIYDFELMRNINPSITTYDINIFYKQLYSNINTIMNTLDHRIIIDSNKTPNTIMPKDKVIKILTKNPDYLNVWRESVINITDTKIRLKQIVDKGYDINHIEYRLKHFDVMNIQDDKQIII